MEKRVSWGSEETYFTQGQNTSSEVPTTSWNIWGHWHSNYQRYVWSTAYLGQWQLLTVVGKLLTCSEAFVSSIPLVLSAALTCLYVQHMGQSAATVAISKSRKIVLTVGKQVKNNHYLASENVSYLGSVFVVKCVFSSFFTF